MTRHRRSSSAAWRARVVGCGFTLFELAITMSVIGVLIVVFLGRVSFYRDEAERLAYEQTVTALDTEVRLQALAFRLGGEEGNLRALTGQNPMNWLAQKPANYLGEFYSPDVKKLSSGNWFFDRNDGILVYLLNQRNIFDLEDSELPKFKVSLSHGSGNVAGMADKLELVRIKVRKEMAVK